MRRWEIRLVGLDIRWEFRLWASILYDGYPRRPKIVREFFRLWLILYYRFFMV